MATVFPLQDSYQWTFREETTFGALDDVERAFQIENAVLEFIFSALTLTNELTS